jgi:hypothetical protein
MQMASKINFFRCRPNQLKRLRLLYSSGSGVEGGGCFEFGVI